MTAMIKKTISVTAALLLNTGYVILIPAFVAASTLFVHGTVTHGDPARTFLAMQDGFQVADWSSSDWKHPCEKDSVPAPWLEQEVENIRASGIEIKAPVIAVASMPEAHHGHIGMAERGCIRVYALVTDPDTLRIVILHELAHLEAGLNHAHGPAWQEKVASLGAPGEARRYSHCTKGDTRCRPGPAWRQ